MRRKERQITGEETEEILKNGEYGIFSSVGKTAIRMACR